jgi:hypothetical protein
MKTTKEKQKKSNLFLILDDIRINKSGDLLEDDGNLKDFNNFIVLKFLSMDLRCVGDCNLLNQYQGILDKKQIYKLLVDIIPENRNFVKFIGPKKESNEYIEFIENYFECSRKEALEYISLKGEDWAKSIMQEFGGKDGIRN